MFESGNYKGGVKGLNSTFAGTDVRFAYKKSGDNNIVGVKIDGVKGTKPFNIDNPREYEQMMNYLNTNSKTLKGVDLGPSSRDWVDFDGSSLFDAMLASNYGFDEQTVNSDMNGGSTDNNRGGGQVTTPNQAQVPFRQFP